MFRNSSLAMRTAGPGLDVEDDFELRRVLVGVSALVVFEYG